MPENMNEFHEPDGNPIAAAVFAFLAMCAAGALLWWPEIAWSLR